MPEDGSRDSSALRQASTEKRDRLYRKTLWPGTESLHSKTVRRFYGDQAQCSLRGRFQQKPAGGPDGGPLTCRNPGRPGGVERGERVFRAACARFPIARRPPVERGNPFDMRSAAPPALLFTAHLIGLVALLATGAALSAQQETKAEETITFRSDVSLVRVDAQVVDRSNRAITVLTKEDFVLREEGKEQEIRNFSREEMPVDVVLLLDVSGSMRPHVERVATAAHQALRALGNDDRVAVMVFDRAARLRLPFRDSMEAVEYELQQLLRQETFNGGTDITRALYEAATYLSRSGRRDARKAVVILTDDQTERDKDVDGVLRAMTRADAVVSALLAPDAMGNRPVFGGGRGGGGGGSWPNGNPGGVIWGRRSPYPGQDPSQYPGRFPGGSVGSRTHSAGTAEIARWSGGDSMPVDDAQALETTLMRIRQRYALHFYLPNGVRPGQERNIEVDLSAKGRRRYPDAEVRYRRVYMAPEGLAGGESPITERRTSPADDPDRPVVSRTPSRRRPMVDPLPEGPRVRSVPTAETEAPRASDRPPTAQEPQLQARPEPTPPPCGWRKPDEAKRPCTLEGDPKPPVAKLR